MVNRLAGWAIVIWSAFMAMGIFAAFLGIGGDCSGLPGSELTACQADAWGRGMVGLGILLVLWLVVVMPMVIVWLVSRPKERVTVVGPEGQRVTLSEADARRRVREQGWSYQQPAQTSQP